VYFSLQKQKVVEFLLDARDSVVFSFFYWLVCAVGSSARMSGACQSVQSGSISLAFTTGLWAYVLNKSSQLFYLRSEKGRM
jgi:hypothetical protein